MLFQLFLDFNLLIFHDKSKRESHGGDIPIGGVGFSVTVDHGGNSP
jgi:hypothetical protein